MTSAKCARRFARRSMPSFGSSEPRVTGYSSIMGRREELVALREHEDRVASELESVREALRDLRVRVHRVPPDNTPLGPYRAEENHSEKLGEYQTLLRREGVLLRERQTLRTAIAQLG